MPKRTKACVLFTVADTQGMFAQNLVDVADPRVLKRFDTLPELRAHVGDAIAAAGVSGPGPGTGLGLGTGPGPGPSIMNPLELMDQGIQVCKIFFRLFLKMVLATHGRGAAVTLRLTPEVAEAFEDAERSKDEVGDDRPWKRRRGTDSDVDPDVDPDVDVEDDDARAAGEAFMRFHETELGSRWSAIVRPHSDMKFLGLVEAWLRVVRAPRSPVAWADLPSVFILASASTPSQMGI